MMTIDVAVILVLGSFLVTVTTHQNEASTTLTLAEDDIILSRDQEEMMFGDDVIVDRVRHRRNVRTGADYRWEMPIRYRIADTFDVTEKRVIYSAMREWQLKTCIRFSELPSDLNYTKPFLVFRDSRSLIHGCLSFIGDNKMAFGQPVMLGRKCFDKLGRLLHELGHVLGLLHEHMRPNRDDYVTVKAPNANVNFKKADTGEIEDFGITYDFNSVMHYPTLDTKIYQLRPKDSRYLHNIGQRTALSFLDVHKINMAYCKDSCSTSRYPTPECKHGGYQHPTRCFKCHCPEGFGGIFCQLSAWHRRAKCGGELDLVDNAYHAIWSPGYLTGEGYRPGTECNWFIKVPAHNRVLLRFYGEFSVTSDSESSCYSWVEVKTATADFGLPGYRFCGDQTPRGLYLSDTTELVVSLRISPHVHHTQARGFFAHIFRVPGRRSRGK